jgi:hypothetical protein
MEEKDNRVDMFLVNDQTEKANRKESTILFDIPLGGRNRTQSI